MAKFAFVVLAVVACAMAQELTPFDFICSVSGTGKATIPGMGEYSVRMIRVKDTARYNVLDLKGNVIATIVHRPDLQHTYFSMKSLSPNSCQETSCLALSDYEMEGEATEGAVFTLEEDSQVVAEMEFNEDYKLSREFFKLPLPGNVNVTIEYSSVNYSYWHGEEDDFFSLDDDSCPAAASDATEALSRDCGDVTMPINMCAVSAIGTSWFVSEELTVKMVRVNDYVRYDFFKDRKMTQLDCTYLNRPDAGRIYIYRPGETSSCNSPFKTWNLTEYTYEGLVDGLDLFTTYLGLMKLFFDHQTHKLVREVIVFGNFPMSINYDSVDYDYVHNVADSEFNLNYEECPDVVKVNAAEAVSSVCPRIIYPQFPSCAFDMSVMLDGQVMSNAKVLMGDDNYGFVSMGGRIMRCDIRSRKGRCLVVDRDDECSEEFEYFSEIVPTTFTYYDEPETVPCPDDSSVTCKDYCYDKKNNVCVTVDENNRLHGFYGYSVSFSDPVPTVDDFKVKMCGGRQLDAPEDPCIPDPSSSAHSSSDSGTSTQSSGSSGTSSHLSSNSGSSAHSSTKPTEPSDLSSASFSFPSILLFVAVLFALF